MSSRNCFRSDQVSQLLDRWMRGDAEAFKSLVPIVYGELQRLAHNRLRQRQNQTLQTTALVHEAYLRLERNPPRAINDRQHFFAMAAGVMRQVLVDQAREKAAAKRAGGIRLELQPEMMPASGKDVDVLALDEVLTALAKLDARQEQIVELRFFAGLSIAEIARLLGVSQATVKREWSTARLWLHNAMR